jgi:signal peptidase I
MTGPERNVSWLQLITIGRSPKVTLVRAVILALMVIGLFRFILLPVRVSGISMEPTYHDCSVNLINRLAYLRQAPRRGDVVGIRFAGPSVMLLKRVVGLPGETIAFSDGRVVVNGMRLDEPYVKNPSDWERDPVTLGPDEYFVVGDNRSMPIQNHQFGIADRARILGKTML